MRAPLWLFSTWIAALWLTLAFAPTPLRAESFADTALAVGVLSHLREGESLAFHHRRDLAADTAPQAPDSAPDYNRLSALEGDTLTLTRRRDEAQKERLDLTATTGTITRPISQFAPDGPNPVLIYFLENILRVMAQETGGNPHYIRNHMRISIGQQEVQTAENGEAFIRYRPFELDPNAARMGPFSALDIEIRWRPEAPGMLRLLKANLPENPARYSEIITLTPPSPEPPPAE